MLLLMANGDGLNLESWRAFKFFFFFNKLMEIFVEEKDQNNYNLTFPILL